MAPDFFGGFYDELLAEETGEVKEYDLGDWRPSIGRKIMGFDPPATMKEWDLQDMVQDMAYFKRDYGHVLGDLSAAREAYEKDDDYMARKLLRRVLRQLPEPPEKPEKRWKIAKETDDDYDEYLYAKHRESLEETLDHVFPHDFLDDASLEQTDTICTLRVPVDEDVLDDEVKCLFGTDRLIVRVQQVTIIASRTFLDIQRDKCEFWLEGKKNPTDPHEDRILILKVPKKEPGFWDSFFFSGRIRSDNKPEVPQVVYPCDYPDNYIDLRKHLAKQQHLTPNPALKILEDIRREHAQQQKEKHRQQLSGYKPPVAEEQTSAVILVDGLLDNLLNTKEEDLADAIDAAARAIYQHDQQLPPHPPPASSSEEVSPPPADEDKKTEGGGAQKKEVSPPPAPAHKEEDKKNTETGAPLPVPPPTTTSSPQEEEEKPLVVAPAAAAATTTTKKKKKGNFVKVLIEEV